VGLKLSPEQLRCRVHPDTLDFVTTQELDEFNGILGQTRATQALNFGLGIEQAGYNIYLAGANGTSRTRYLLDYLHPLASQRDTPPDWLYVNNFDNHLEPRAISLPTRQGKQLRRELDRLVDALLDTFPATFDNPSYQQRKRAVQVQFDQRYEDAINTVKRAASDMHIATFMDEGTVTFTPIIDGKVIDESQYATLSQDETDTFNGQVEVLEKLLNDALLELPQWQRDLSDQLRQLREDSIRQALKPLLQPLRQNYLGNTAVSLFLAQIGNHLPRVIEEHFSDQRQDHNDTPAQMRKLLENLYLPNLLTSSIEAGGPIVQESNPSYQNLFGRVSYGSDEAQPAFQQITSGALHRANGGYLIIDVEKLLNSDSSWAALKRMLRDGSIYPEPPPGDIQISGVTPLRPEAIPLKVKVILIGPRDIYYALDRLDRDFNQLFRVLVDFEDYFDSSDANLKQFAQLLHSRSREAGTAELSAAAVARLAEYSHRMAEHQQRMTTRIDPLIDVAVEADFKRQREQKDLIEVEHINLAITSRRLRNSRQRDQLLNAVLEGTLVISSDGTAVGQINGLSLFQIGDIDFGCPTRITATVHPGHRGVVDIEREAELGQAVHSKGVMILTGYLCSFYTQEVPLAMSAYIAMEQSYGFIDGDSASLAELCALLSALVKQPIRQDLAVTGSINQRGEIQAVGGVNEKVECFFDLCQARDLKGHQGVILPAANQESLMLSERVIAAVACGQFSIHTAATVDQALAILTNKEPGKANSKGKFPKGTFNDRVVKRLEHFAKLTRSVVSPNGDTH